MTPSLPGYDFIRPLGRGAHGEVWLTRDRQLQIERAVKFLRRDRFSAAELAYLVQEARTMAQLPRHRNCVQVHALLPEENPSFLVMDYIEGGPLSDQTRPESPMAWERAARYVADVADALRVVHEAGILHRDIKPANILWDRRGDEALLSDFGIAARAVRAEGVAGTPGYIAPEVCDGQITPLADVYALAGTLYSLVAGQPPFTAGRFEEIVQMSRVGLRRPVAALGQVPEPIEDLIVRGLAPRPEDRPDLVTFTASLRGAHLHLLAGRLLQLAQRAGCPTALRVSSAVADGRNLQFVPVSYETQRPTSTRDLAPVPLVVARTGNLLQFEITADADGYLTVLNLGSSGALTVIFPNPMAPNSRLQVGQVQRLTVKLTSPAGTDRAAFIWSRRSSALTPEEWRTRIEIGQAAQAPPAVATRGLAFVLHEARNLSAEDWTAKVIQIQHE